MKGNLYQLIKRFWLLGLISLASTSSFAWFIINRLFPNFLSNTCGQGDYCNWGLLEGYVGFITLAILVGGLVFTVWEYSRRESQISFQIYEAIHEKITDPAEEAARRWIINEITVFEDEENITLDEWIEKTFEKIQKQPRGWKEKISPGHKSVKMTLNTLDYVGFVSQNYVNVEGPLLEWMSSPIAKVWMRLKPYIDYERNKKKEPDYYQAAYHIGEKCVIWRNNKGMISKFMANGI